MWTYKVLPQSTEPVDVEMFSEYGPELFGQNFESKAEFRTCLSQPSAKPSFISAALLRPGEDVVFVWCS